ncbi:MAG: phosphopyruvate hydratase [Clostridia bacterium]|nr:phosphopyruvate hydratase [Clostridia bacterium]
MKSENTKIVKVTAREILDSRGNPTLEASVVLADGSVGVASVPSGASTGAHEAHERRDSHMERFDGLGVHCAMNSVRGEVADALVGKNAVEQCAIDHALTSLDESENKKNIGANAMLSVSLATARAAAVSEGTELYRYLGGVGARSMPAPMMNILNGGAHASNNVEIQEFMIVPEGMGALCEAVRAGAEIYHELGRILKKRGYSTGVGDEGGFAPDLSSDEEAIELICEAIVGAGYDTDRVKLALDVASSGWYDDAGYKMPKRNTRTDRDGLIKYYEELISDYPIISIEDGLAEDDFEGWSDMTRALGGRVMLVGDDLFVTNVKRLRRGIDERAANAILIKPNQIGTLTETLDVIRVAREHGYKFIISHRSGETEDSFIADLAVATGAPYIKAGAPCRTDRTVKYNRLMHIEAMLGCGAVFGDK